MKRTIQTASGINAPQERWKALNEIDAVRFLFVLLIKIFYLFDIIFSKCETIYSIQFL